MLIRHDFSRSELICSACTLTGGPLVKRYWNAESEGLSKLGNRVVSIALAIPVLGGIITLIVALVDRYLAKRAGIAFDLYSKDNNYLFYQSRYSVKEPKAEQYRQMPFDQCVALTPNELALFKMDGLNSDLSCYKGSIFDSRRCQEGLLVIRRKEAIMLPSGNERVK